MTETEQLAKEIAAQIMPQVPLSMQYWSARQVGAYLDVTPRHVTERLSNRPGFPPGYRLPSDGGKGQLRWLASDVIEWMKRHKA